MSYQVIARKYRPQRFSDVVGQEHVTQTLSNAVEQNRIAHAYLFVGPRGTGKTTIARIFAKCLNCTDGPKSDFAEDDPRCQEIAEGRSLDVLEIDGASNRGIEEIRELRETVKYAPAASRFKVYIIDEVHMLTKEAFNALLKTLEEPPAHVKFMFATTEPEKILPTILSRCQRFDLRRIPVALIVEHLAGIAKLEKVQIEEAALFAIARGADGGMRDAESALDQLISFCGAQIVESDVLSMFGLAAQGQILALADAVLKGEAEKIVRELNELTRHGKDLGRLLSDILAHMRNLLVYKVSRGDLSLLEVSETERACLMEQAEQVTEDTLTRIMELLTESERPLREASSKKIFLEVALLKAIQARNAVSIDTLLKQLQQMRKGETGSAGKAAGKAGRASTDGVATAAQSHPPAAPMSRSTETAPAPAPSEVRSEGGTAIGPSAHSDLDGLWQEVLAAAGRASAFTRSYLLEAHPVSFAKNVFTIGFDPEFREQLDLVNNQRTHALLQTKLEELGHPNVQIKFIQSESTLPRARPAKPSQSAEPASAPPQNEALNAVSEPERAEQVKPQRLNAEEFKNDPLIQRALEIFKGQIVEVRV